MGAALKKQLLNQAKYLPFIYGEQSENELLFVESPYRVVSLQTWCGCW